MLSRVIASGVGRRAASRAQPTSARLFSAKGPELVVDKEANKEQMAQVTRQMEDAILKEKDVQESQSVPKMNSAWDTKSDVHKEIPDDPALEQNKTREMNAIFDEQVELAKKGTLHGQENNSPYKGEMSGNLETDSAAKSPDRIEGQETMTDKLKHTMESASQSVKGMMSSNPSTTGDTGIIDKVKTTMEGASKSVKEVTGIDPSATGDVIVDKLKTTMEDTSKSVKEMMGTNSSTTDAAGVFGKVNDSTKSMREGVKQTVGTAAASVMGLGQNVKESVMHATGSVKNLGQGMKQTVQDMGEGVRHTIQDTTESVRDMGRGTKETFTEAGAAITDLRKGMRDGIHDASLTGLGDGTRKTMSDASKNLRGFSDDLRDVTKKNMEDLTEMAKGVMTSSHPLGEVLKEPFEDKHKHETGLDSDAEKKKKPEPVSSSDRKTNASLF